MSHQSESDDEPARRAAELQAVMRLMTSQRVDAEGQLDELRAAVIRFEALDFEGRKCSTLAALAARNRMLRLARGER